MAGSGSGYLGGWTKRDEEKHDKKMQLLQECLEWARKKANDDERKDWLHYTNRWDDVDDMRPMTGADLVWWLTHRDMLDKPLTVAFRQDDQSPTHHADITSVCMNGNTIQLNEETFDRTVW